MSVVFRCFVGPRLYRKFRADSNRTVDYVPGTMESTSENLLKCLSLSWRVCTMTSPLIALMLWRRGYFSSLDGMQSLGKFGTTMTAVALILWLCQGFARTCNPMYIAFLRDFMDVQAGRKGRALLRKYDFDFSHWPYDYSVKIKAAGQSRPTSEVQPSIVGPSGAGSRARLASAGSSHNDRSRSGRAQQLAYTVLGYIASRSFARWLMYPGSTGLLNAMISSALIEARKNQIEMGGYRAKVETYLGNRIDTMFFDRRQRSSSGSDKGNVLVVCSEGNAAFYENGCTCTPLAAGYSVLGWNHPGFGCSSMSGKPYPAQEQDAIDAVMQYAVNELGFAVSDIVLFCWSIGGYASSWAASRYPDVRALILDASFDDILPLAQERMPKSWGDFVELAVTRYMHLDNASLVCQYPGPVLLIRRTMDELISTVPGDLLSNRGNELLRRLLLHRYPHLLAAGSEADSALLEWLAAAGEAAHGSLLTKHGYSEERCKQLLREHDDGSQLSADLPMQDKVCLVMYLAKAYMRDFVSQHCAPLPAEYFVIPSKIVGGN